MGEAKVCLMGRNRAERSFGEAVHSGFLTRSQASGVDFMDRNEKAWNHDKLNVFLGWLDSS
jgi:hypothetical protein